MVRLLTNNLVMATSQVDTQVGFTIVLSPMKLTISQAKGRMIIWNPGGVWK